jgi:cytochrome c oxidase subunit III
MSENAIAVGPPNLSPLAPRLSPLAPVPSPLIHHPSSLIPAQWGMLAFLLSEVALFSTLIVTYIALLGHDRVGPTPAEALKLPLVICTTVLLLSSSVTIHLAQHALRHGARTAFCAWWAATITLGIAFLAGTGYEWYGLVTEYRLTPSRNLFGSAYYTLVGLHGMHVTAGVVTMTVVLGLVLRRTGIERKGAAVEVVGWYWHFVDAVWVVVFTVVYVVGR